MKNLLFFLLLITRSLSNLNRTYYEGKNTYNPVRSEQDRNFDGKFDSFDEYDEEGLIKITKSDNNFDDHIDVILTNHKGVARSVEYDINYDGKFEVFETYGDNGVLKSSKSDLNSDGNFDVVSQYNDNGTVSLMQKDHDFDGKFEASYSYDLNGILLRSEEDRNGDGKVDEIATYNMYGNYDDMRLDNNFDGRFETHVIYKNGSLLKSETDIDGDDKVDSIEQYALRVLSKITFLDPHADQTVKINYYDNNRLKFSDFDANGDGLLDTRYLYDRYEQIVKTEELQ